jgi:hypothetical protein
MEHRCRNREALFDWPHTGGEENTRTLRQSSAFRLFYGIGDGQELGQRQSKPW